MWENVFALVALPPQDSFCFFPSRGLLLTFLRKFLSFYVRMYKAQVSVWVCMCAGASECAGECDCPGVAAPSR